MRGGGIRIRKVAGLFFAQTALFVLVILAICMATPLHIALLRVFEASERSGFSPQEVGQIARDMVSVMRGADREILARWFTADEVLHMKDVQWLFALGGKLLLVLAGAALLGLLGGKSPSPREGRAALWTSLLVPLALAVPFAVDFTGMFIWLHRVAFPDNELWLMDPRIHRMVVVYSEPFFIAIVAIIGLACAAAVVPLAVWSARGKER